MIFSRPRPIFVGAWVAWAWKHIYWPPVGRAVAALLRFPIKAEEGKDEACLEAFRNKLLYINSFTASQQEMLESIYRVSGTSKSSWHINEEPATDRYASALEAMKAGDRMAFVRMMMYTRVFHSDGCGDHGRYLVVDRLGQHETLATI